jgi:hypothetical protein
MGPTIRSALVPGQRRRPELTTTMTTGMTGVTSQANLQAGSMFTQLEQRYDRISPRDLPWILMVLSFAFGGPVLNARPARQNFEKKKKGMKAGGAKPCRFGRAQQQQPIRDRNFPQQRAKTTRQSRWPSTSGSSMRPATTKPRQRQVTRE